MRKLFFLTAIVSLLFAGCNNDNENYDPNDPSTERAKLLPSKIVIPQWVGTAHFRYDELNRLTKFLGGGDTATVIYNVNDNPITMTDRWRVSEFRYDGNLIFITHRDLDDGIVTGIDTLTIGVGGRLESIRSGWWYRTFVYNSNGDLIRIKGILSNNDDDMVQISDTFDIIPSDVRSILRHVNAPRWFPTMMSGISMFSDKRNMPAQIICTRRGEIHRFSYRLDADGYVRQMDWIMRNWYGEWETTVFTVEYIPAR